MSRTLKQFEKSARAVVKAEGSLRERMQALLVECVEQAHEHGDTSKMSLMYSLFSDSHYRPAMSKWFRAFTGTTIRETEDGGAVYSFKKDNKPADVDVSGAKATPFWSMGGSTKDPEVLDMKKVLVGLLAKADKAEKEGKEIKNPLNATQRKIIKQMATIETTQVSGLIEHKAS